MALYQKTFEDFKRGYLGFATLAIIGQSCLGSAAAMYILKNGNSVSQMLQLAVIVIVCMVVNGSILAQQKPRIVFNLIITSVVASVFMIVLNTLFV